MVATLSYHGVWMSTQKVSVSLRAEELRWVRAAAKKYRLSVSSLVNEAVRRFREEKERKQAQEALLAQFEPAERATDSEMEVIREEWRRA